MPIVTFIIPTKDRDAILFQSLEQLLTAVTGLDVEVLVINDDKGRKIPLPAEWASVQVLENPGKGVASARNFGASRAAAPLLWFLDDDIWVSHEVVKQGLLVHRQRPDAVFNFNWVYPEMLLQKVLKAPFGRFLQSIEFTSMKGWCKGMDWKENELMETQGLAGATLLISADAYAAVGGYDASFPLAGFEDHDFSVRVQRAGLKCYIDARVMTYHNEVNKTSLPGFLKRTFQNAITRRHAVEIGYKDQELKYTGWRSIKYRIAKFAEPLLLLCAQHWPDFPVLDGLYFRICQLLIGVNMYKGYNARKEIS